MKTAIFGVLLAVAVPAWAHPGGGGSLDATAPVYGGDGPREAAAPWDTFSDSWVAHDSTGKALPLAGDADVHSPQPGQIAVLRVQHLTVDGAALALLADTRADAIVFDADTPDFAAQTAAYAALAQKLRMQGDIVPQIAFAASDAVGVTRAWQAGLKLNDPDLLEDGNNLLLFAEPGFDGGPDAKGFSRQNISSASVFIVDLSDSDSLLNTVASIRRFKGARPQQPASKEQAIVIDGKFKEWKAVSPEFRDSLGETDERNDIQSAKIARDAGNIAFYLRARAAFALDAKDGLQLWLDTDQNSSTGWNGFDFSVALDNTDVQTASIFHFDGARWAPIGSVPIAFNGNELELIISRTLLGLKTGQGFDFHWHSGAAEDAKSGENAPDDVFNFRFEDRAE